MNNGSKKFVQSVWKGRVLKKEKNIDDLFNFIFIATLAAGVMVSFFMNCVNRSLWLDEAWLASPFSTRSFWKLGDGSFENGQIAPLGWLYMEKALTLLFGNTEFVLRMGSVIGLVFSLFLIYYLIIMNCVPIWQGWRLSHWFSRMMASDIIWIETMYPGSRKN